MDSNAFEWPLMTIKDMISLKLHRWLTKVSKGFLVGPHHQKKPKQLSLPKETHLTRVKFGFQNLTNSQIPLPAEGDLPQDLLLATSVGNSPGSTTQKAINEETWLFLDYLPGQSTGQHGMLPWWPLLRLLSWHPVIMSSHRNSFEDWGPVNFIYMYPNFKWNVVTWQEREGTRVVVLAMTTRWHTTLNKHLTSVFLQSSKNMKS